MDLTELKQNADFLSIALESMEDGTAEYEFVQDVYESLMEEISDRESE